MTSHLLMQKFARCPRLLLVCWLSVLIAYYLAVGSTIDVGYFNDDARYIMAAQSLAQGSYVDLDLPAHPPNIDRLPGYPMFLMPFIKVIAPHWAWLKLTSALLSALSCSLLYGLSEGILPSGSRLLLIAMFGLNPTVAKYSGSVMSEPLFTFVTLLTFVLFKRWLDQNWLSRLAPLILTLTYAAFVRPEGLALLVALPIALAVHRRPRTGLLFLLIPSIVFSLLLMRNYSRTQIPSGYFQQWTEITLFLSGHCGPVFENMGKSLKVLFVDTVLQASLPWGSLSVRRMWAGALCLLAIGLVLKGYLANRRNPQSPPILTTSAGVYLLCYLMMHGIFLSLNTRYYFAVLPFILTWIMLGARTLAGRLGHSRFWMVLGFCGLLFLYENPWSSPADKISAWQRHSYRNAWQTLAWIRNSTSPDAFVLAVKASTLHLYTDRFSISELPAPDVEGFRYELLKNGVTHILVAPNRLMVLGGKNFQDMMMLWNRTDLWIPLWRGAAFTKVYANSSEGTLVYRVIPDPEYQAAYELCQSADSDFSGGHWAAGIAKLQRALTLNPRLPGALNRLGMALLAWRDDRSAAEKAFLEAVRLCPTFTLALVNLSRMYWREGNRLLAETYMERANRSIEHAPSWSGDRRAIKQLLDSNQTY